jgi:2-polyprenyl-3-methyl-5-hydroxy-6-metoxy-1,4-benzoquinol methylase
MTEMTDEIEPQATPSPFVNTADPRQDVHRVREHDPNQARYRAAEGLLPERAVGKVLELGGGTGAFSQRLRDRGYEVAFADLSESNLQRASAAGFEVHGLDLNFPLPFEDATFEGVTMLEIIEHIVAAEQLLSEVARVLKPGGFVILSTPNFSFLLNRFRILRGRLSVDEGYHYRFFNPRVLRSRFTDAGLVVEESSHLVPAFGFNIFWNKVLKHPRVHVHVPTRAASWMAHTLVVKAIKPTG